MKNLLIIATALVACLASCTSVKQERPASEISFQVARHCAVTKAGPADYKDAYGQVPFGTYSWYKALNEEENTVYFTNRKVSYDEPNNRWITEGKTYYWPYTGVLDFISYSPYTVDGADAPAPIITETGINYSTPWNVDAHQSVDVMYADKAIGQSRNLDTFGHGYQGVPTLFRHALARVAFLLKASTLSRVSPTGEVTRWEIDVKTLQLNNIFTTGTLSLTLAEDGSWAKPVTNAWTPTDATINRQIDLGGVHTLTEESQSAGSIFVLPQTLVDQDLTLVVDIRTYRDSGEGEKLIITESDVVCHASLTTETFDTWGINQYITYIITVSPVSEIDTDFILFDPAVAGWDEKVVETAILL